MAKQLNVDMRFTADTSKAKQAINDLEQSLQKLGHGAMPKEAGIDPAQFEKASAAARELEFHLKNAYNIKTGNLDLSKLQSSLQSSGTSLKQLTSNFSQAGSVGTQAFTSLARAIATADQPMLTLNTHLGTMWTTLKNVARFQLSSSIMHGLIGGIQSAYGYAQDLNKSLNNIRIVTGQSTDQMARFAEQANKGARALSTTTLDYTDAALIYYQQGLSNEEVVKRTETTLKLANVSRQSAEEVSSQMTAIWNNFDDGSKSLEYYADVITALGATTAASSEEIANGVSKFAAVAQTVGLSYEYAASALATIVAETRQSEDTVGNGLRTLLARFEGLQLGKTLEDGVDLNKYSKALKAIGVDVLDANGNLRQMDDILDDMGEKWDTLTDAQKVALAQTVGGVRQYTNLIALMDNWDKFQQNVGTALESEGTVDKQAKIYAESWEGARDRVKAAAESIFQALLDDKFFIKITNFIEKLLVNIRSFIDNFGGIKAILTAVLSFTLSTISTKIGPAVHKVVQDIQILSGGANKIYQKMQSETNSMVDDELSKKTSSGKDLYNEESKASLQGSKALLNAKTKLSLMENKLSAAEKMRAEVALSGLQKQIEYNEKLGKTLDDLKEKEIELTDQYKQELKIAEQKELQGRKDLSEESKKAINNNVQDAYRKSFSSQNIDVNRDSVISLQAARDDALQIGNELRRGLVGAFMDGETEAANFNQALQSAIDIIGNGDFYKSGWANSLEEAKGKLEILKSSFGDLIELSPELDTSFKQAFSASTTEELDAAVDQIIKNLETLKEQGIDVEEALEKLKISPKSLQTFKTLQKELRQLKKEEEEIDKLLKKEKGNEAALSEAGKKRLKIRQQIKEKEKEIKDAIAKTNKEAENLKFSHVITGTEAFSKLAAGIGSAATALRSLSSLFDALTNVDLSFGEALIQSLMAISMLVPSVTTLFSGLSTVISFVGQRMAFAAAETLGYSGAEATAIATSQAGIIIRNAKVTGLKKEQITTLASELSLDKLAAAESKEALINNLVAKGIDKNTASQIVNNGIKSTSVAIQTLLAVITGKLSAAQAAENLRLAVQNGVLTANFAVKAAIAILDGNYIGVVVALGVAAAIATGVIIANTRASKEAAKAKEEEAKKSAELAKTEKEEAKAAYDLYKAYKDAFDLYKKTGDGKDDLKEKARELAEAIHLENIELMLQAGLYEDILELGRQYSAQQAIEANRAALVAQERARINLQSQIEQNEGNSREYTGSVQGNNYVLQLENGGKSSDESITIEAIQAVQEKYADQEGVTIEPAGGGEYNIIVPNTKEGMLLLQAITQDIQSETLSRGGGSESELFQGATNFSIDNADALQMLQEASDLVEDNDYAQGLIIPDEAITSAEEYLALREELNHQLEEQYGSYLNVDQRNDIISKALRNNEYTADYQVMMDAMEQANFSSQSDMDAFQEQWANWTPEQKQVVLRIIAKGEPINIDEIIQGVDTWQDKLDFDALTNNIEILDNLTATLKDGSLSTEDLLTAYRNNPEMFQKAGIMDEAQLVYMSNTEVANALSAERSREAEQLRGISNRNQEKQPEVNTSVEEAQEASDRIALANENAANAEKREQLIYRGLTGIPDIDAPNRQQYDEAQRFLQDLNEGNAGSQYIMDTENYPDWEAADYGRAWQLYEYLRSFQEDNEDIDLNDFEAVRNTDSVAYQALMELGSLYGYDTEREMRDEGIDWDVRVSNANRNSWYNNTGEAAAGRLGTIDAYEYSQLFPNYDYMADLDDAKENGIEKYQQLSAQARRTASETQNQYGATAAQLETRQQQASLVEGAILDEETNLDWIQNFREEMSGLNLNYDEVREFAVSLQELSTSSDDLADSLKDDEKTALLVSKSMSQLNRGVESLQSNWDDLNSILSSGSKGSLEYKRALRQTKDAMGDVLGITDELLASGISLSDQFIENAMASGDLEKAMQGDSEAIDRLRFAATQDILFSIAVSNGFSEDQAHALLAEASDSLSYIQQMLPDLEIGASIDDEGFLAACTQMINAAGMTAEQAEAFLASMGVDAEIESVDVSTEDTHTYQMPKWKKNDEGYLEFDGTEEKTFTHTSTGTKGTALKITSAHKTSGGNIGLNPSKIGGGKSGGGGGGGGKTSTKEKKEPTDERDRYHAITQKIQDATDAYNKLSKAQDRAFGKERIKAMEGITNNLHLQIELQKQYLDEIRNYLEGDRAAVEALGATFDANGVITNYDDLIAELVAKYNEGVDAFNNGGLDEDAFKEQYEEPFNDAKDAIDQYVETINLLQSEELNLIDQQNELADQLREIAAYKLELHIDIDEDELQYLDFLLNMLGENAEDAVDRLDLLGQQFNTNRDEIAAYTTAIQDLLRLRGFTDEDVAAFIRGELTAGDLEERGFTTDDIDKLREYRDAIQDNTTAMNDLVKEIEESFLNTLDDLNEKVDDAEERFEHFATMLEHFHNVVDIVGQDALGMSAETMKLLAKAAKENAIEMVKAAKTQLDSLNAVRTQAQAQLDAALEAQKNASTAEEKLRAEEAVRYWSDTINEVTNRVEQAEEDLADALENALEGIQEMYTTMIEQATKEFEHSVTGAAGSLEQLQNNFDRQKEIQELYIPTYEKIYELTKLTRDINNSIDDTDNLWSKQELAKLQDEINQKMEDGVELTEHDVEELRKRYELKLAEAALEEAQDAKRTVRMSRDNEGNWSYVYTADENDVAAAEQSYEDKLHEYQQMNYEYIQELQGNIIQAEQDMTDQINDLDVTKFASKEAYLAEIQRIMDATQAKEQQYKDQLAQTLDQQGILYEEDWKRYNELTGYRMARDDQWVDNWNETILAQQTGFETLEEMFDQLTDAIGSPEESGTYVGDITDAYAEMQASNERALNAAGTSMQTYEQDTVDAISGIDQQMEETQNQVDEFTNSMAEAMEGVSDFIGEWKNQYGEAVKSITEFNKDLYDSCNTLIKKLQDTYGVNADFEAAQAQAAAEALAGSSRGNSSENGSSSKDGSPNNEDDRANNWHSNGLVNLGSTHCPSYYNDLGQTWNDTKNAAPHSWKYVGSEQAGNNRTKIMYSCECGATKTETYKGLIDMMKTGGYTGTWSAASAKTGMYTGSWNGPDLEENGRLAFLHQKELVLNASDTENFLSAVDMVRQISQTIDLQAASRSNGWSFLLPGVLSKEPNTLDQNVHIEAHFPNVTSHSEIEEAFTNLVGKASQFANR